MDNIITILEGISKLLWPIIILFIVIRYSTSISEFIRSLSKRKMTVKVGDKHITLDEASEQQVELMADLHREILEIKTKIKGLETGDTNTVIASKSTLQTKTILWVDDEPHKHAYVIEHIKSLGFTVYLNASTTEALDFLKNNHPDFIISDLGRAEKEGYDSLAGVHLAREVRKIKPAIPIYVFSEASNMITNDVEKGTISLATASHSELIEHLVLASKMIAD